MRKLFVFSFLMIASFIVNETEARHCCRSKSGITFRFGQQVSRPTQVVYYAPSYPMVVAPYYPYGGPMMVAPSAPVYYIERQNPTSFFEWGFSHRF